MATAFETEPCTRCGGTGHYSFNGEHSRCYKCDGKNGARSLTKRGVAAKAYYLAKFRVAASDIKIGDMIETGNGQKLRVVEIETKDETVIINGETRRVKTLGLIGKSWAYYTGLSAIVRRYPTPEENDAAIADALAYQATLTKAGKPRKSKG